MQSILNPWFSIWRRPHITVQTLLNAPATHREHILATVFAISDALGVAVVRNWGDTYTVLEIVLIGVITAPARMVGYLYIYPRAAWLVGRWLGGQASASGIRIATAWSFVPMVWLAPLWLPIIGLFGDALFQDEYPIAGGEPWKAIALFAFFLLQGVGAAWCAVLFIANLAAAQRFAVWKALLNFALAWALLILPIYLAMRWLADGW